VTEEERLRVPLLEQYKMNDKVGPYWRDRGDPTLTRNDAKIDKFLKSFKTPNQDLKVLEMLFEFKQGCVG